MAACMMCMCAVDVETIVLVFMSLLYAVPAQVDNIRSFPPLYNTAKGKPLLPVPFQSTCGYPSRSAYCKSSTYQTSLEQCIQDFCVQDCPRRTFLPGHINMLQATGYGACVTTDTVNRPAGAPAGEYAAVFGTGSQCFLTPLSIPMVGPNGALTITFWIYHSLGTAGTVIDKGLEDGQMVFQVQVSSSSMVFKYRSLVGVQQATFSDNIPLNTWTHVAIQVYESSVSYFLDGLGIGNTASGTQTLAAPVYGAPSGTGRVRVGQTLSGTDQFVGRLEDVRVYSDTLTNREIQLVARGVFPEVRILNECRCPVTHPRVRPDHTRFCIKNGVPDNTGDEMLRLNEYSHPIEYLNDGDSNSFWVSSFLNEVTIEVDLRDQFQVFYVLLQFYSPLPRQVTIERKKTLSSEWEVWQQYAENCTVAFGMQNTGPLPQPDSYNCIQLGMDEQPTPYSKGNITFNILSSKPVPRPGHNDFYNTPALDEFVKASRVRVLLKEVQHAVHLRHKYFAVYELIVTGRCNCHGHAETCDVTTSPYQCHCSPESFTTGLQCERCSPLYNNKPYRVGDQLNAFHCQRCECHSHASSCMYDQSLDPFPNEHDRGGGGVCQNCLHNTQGRDCSECIPGYFRATGKSLHAQDVCSPCNCYVPGVETGASLDCVKAGGQCSCKANVTGRRCDECPAGYFNLQASNPLGCESCYCNIAGSINNNVSCQATSGECFCRRNVRNLQCDACKFGFYGLSVTNPDGCLPCNCNALGSTNLYCDPVSGQCPCKPNIGSQLCDQCSDGYYDFMRGCTSCGCNPFGIEPGTVCDKTSGRCVCKPNVQGLKCDECREGTFNMGSDNTLGCTGCSCDLRGTINSTTQCDMDLGQCICKANVQGQSCNMCLGNTFNLSLDNEEGCQSCDCDVTGTLDGDRLDPPLLPCDQNTGQCACLQDRTGRRCDSCVLGYYVNPVRGGGCRTCNCNSAGTIPNTFCDPFTGQCPCIGGDSGIGGRRCDTCQPGFYQYSAVLARCQPCLCDLAGSVNATCNVNTGQCFCKDFTTGLTCDQCVPGSSDLQLDNEYGCSTTPSQQPPPSYELTSPTAILLIWDPPDYPNGVILTYFIYRNGQQIAAIDPNERQYNDTGLQPFTEYNYEIEARNGHGGTRSPPITIRTLAASPAGVITLNVINIGSVTALFSWNQPSVVNGVIRRYELVATTLREPFPPVTHWTGLGNSAQLDGLVPYTYYLFQVKACTVGGCLSSTPIPVDTKPALPTDMKGPNITALSQTSLFVEWEPPENPNGIIIYYELWMRGLPGPGGERKPDTVRLFQPAGQYNPRPSLSPQETALPPPDTNFTVTNLDPYTAYEFQVLAENAVGKVPSPWVIGRTSEGVPEFMSVPDILTVNSSAVEVRWQEPSLTESRGEIVMYRLYHYRASDPVLEPHAPPYVWQVLYTALGSERSFRVEGLPSYSEQLFQLEACNVVGCVNSSVAVGRTGIAAPREQSRPVPTGYNSTAMQINWAPPSKSNSPNIRYIVRRMNGAFNYPPPKVEEGTRFPGGGWYKFPPDTLPQGVGFSGLEVEFKTVMEEGVMLFAGSYGMQEFQALQVWTGRPWFIFNPQGCATIVQPDINVDQNRTYADNQWHHVLAGRKGSRAEITADKFFSGCNVIVTTTDDEGLPYNNWEWHILLALRNKRRGNITMDGRWTGGVVNTQGETVEDGEDDADLIRDEVSDCATGNIIGQNNGVYIGGVNQDDYGLLKKEDEERRAVSPVGFQGCIRNVRIQKAEAPQERWEELDWSRAVEISDAIPRWEGCPSNHQRGYNFLGLGYATLHQDFMKKARLNSDWDVAFRFRTEIRNGLFFFMYTGPGVYTTAFMENGGLYFEVSNGPSFREVVYFPGDRVTFCNGVWHSVEFYRHGGEIGIRVSSGTGGTRKNGTTSNREMFFIYEPIQWGGIPKGSEAEAFIQMHNLRVVKHSFSGCFKEVRIAKTDVSFGANMLDFANVNFDGCPASSVPESVCREFETEVIYNGTANSAVDLNLQPFTEYMYQVEAYNELGHTVSTWATGRTREGVPSGVRRPINVLVLNGSTVSVEWEEPLSNTGMITRYVIRAYNLDNPSVPPVEEVISNSTQYDTVLYDVVPFTNYTIKLEACTAAGCTESFDGVRITTREEAPSLMQAPYVLDSGGTYIVVAWVPPARANGVITGYMLEMGGSPIYNGGLTFYNVTGLMIFTGYQFAVSACSRVGCTKSETVSLSTAQLPPSLVLPPKLSVRGMRTILVEWLVPDILNGQLKEYMLYASTVSPDDIGELVYNSTLHFTFYNLQELEAGTTYYIRVSACTEGGCTMSAASMATTAESSPEGVPAPLVMSPSPSELNLTWDLPEFPNGRITLYRLYHNGLLVYSDPSVRQYYVGNLQPWSLHTFRVEACTVMGCGSGPEVANRTQESRPLGVVGLELVGDTPKSVMVRWNSPAQPNGQLFFDVYCDGPFYRDPDNWDFATIEDRRSLYQDTLYDEWVRVEGLLPNSIYSIQVNASNSKGFILSNSARANMPMGAPDGVRPPDLMSPTPTSVRATWWPVGRSNAFDNPTFQLQFRETVPGALVQDIFVQPTTSTTYLKEGLQPFTRYEFKLIASNNYGSTSTDWVSITTRQDRPLNIDPPRLMDIESNTVDVYWDPPLNPNGIVTSYKIFINDIFSQGVLSNVTHIVAEGLDAFTFYVFSVEACTLAGCTRSANSREVQTLRAPPEGISAPTVLSETPTSILIVWNPPLHPNGDVISYTLERREVASPIVVRVETFLPTGPLQYLDRSADLVPNREYEYRITALNSAGDGSSPWAPVLTKPARPGGVESPTVDVLSPVSVKIMWRPPRQANGQLESYVIKLPSPRIEIYNTSQTEVIVSDLVPFTEYYVTVTACTDGGCTESTATRVQTQPTLPMGQEPPTATPMSQTYISILWQPPEKRNGPNLRYELARMKVRQPLGTSIEEFGSWTSIYSGVDTYYDDRGLTMYTTYVYRVTVFNDYGHMTSDPSDEVTTFGGVPSRPALVSAQAVNHTAISVSWDTPSVFELQGGVDQFVITLLATDHNLTQVVGPALESVVIGGLEPNTQYAITVTILTHGGEVIGSSPVFVTTLDGAPEGLAAPQLVSINDTALRVMWTAPERPNGRISTYNIYLDDVRIPTGLSYPGAYILGNLQPYTIYSVQVEVCTVFKCILSNATAGTTAESVPQGIQIPSMVALGPTHATISWGSPARPNGIILRYDLWRRANIPCSQQPPPTDPPSGGRCQYFQCSILESFCGSSCYSGPRTCCDGVVHDNRAGYECCGKHYIPRRTYPDDVCCSGRFYTRLPNHQCCSDRYVEVKPGYICCPDPLQERVSVGIGDKCCGGIPYSAKGAQLCCNGILVDKFESQCCGKKVVSNSKICCGNNTEGQAYDPDGAKFCCGTEYADQATSVCCTDDSSISKVHKYTSTLVKDSANEKCCGTERISAGLTCCNRIGYNIATQVCADVSDLDSNCGQGAICPGTLTENAFCDSCSFDRTQYKCGSVAMGTESPPVYDPVNQPSTEMCWTDPVRIYTGLQQDFQDVTLSAFSEYEYAVSAVNGAGSGMSDYVLLVTAQTEPDGVLPPTARVEPDRLDTIFLTWEPPGKPNGEIIRYVLMRNGIEVFRSQTEHQFMDNNAIQPYQTYAYVLSVCTIVGCTNSEPVNVATLQARPEEVVSPTVRVVSPTSLLLQWSMPRRPNGLITQFLLVELTNQRTFPTSGTTLEYLVTELQPYGEYEFLLSACTEAGCSNSTSVTGQTAEGRPSGVMPPEIVVTKYDEVEIYWSEPAEPNGVILSYELYRSSGGPSTSVYIGDANTFSYTESGLTPVRRYQYLLEVRTAAGGSNSTPVSVDMPQLTPEGIPAPYNVRAESATSLFAQWRAPLTPNGQIDQYRVILNAGTAGQLERGVGLDLQAVISGLEPYTVYSVRIRACLQGIPNGCGIGPGVSVRTLEALPSGQGPPTLTAREPVIVDIAWENPVKSNGIITQYRILRRLLATQGPELLINVLDGDSFRFTDAGVELLPFTNYEYRVIAVNSQGEAQSPWQVVRTMEARPQALDAPTVEAVGAFALSVEWKPPLRANGIISRYQIQYRASASDPTLQYPIKTVTVPGNILSTSISGLLPYSEHEVRVVALNGAGEVASQWSLIRTGQASPADIGPFTIEKISDGHSVILRWGTPAFPNGVVNNYLIYEDDNINPIFQGLSREFEYRRLQPYTEYTVQLEACTAGGCGRSPRQSFLTAEIEPANMGSPTIGSINSTHVTLHWIRPVNPNGKILNYQVLRRRDMPRTKRSLTEPIVVYQTENTDAEVYTHVDSGLIPYTQYEYSIKASNLRGATYSPWQAVETDQAAPESLSPPNLVAVAPEYKQIQITWSPPQRPNGVLHNYLLQRNDTVSWSFEPKDNLEYVDSGLNAFTVYSYTIKACTGGGCTVSEPSFIRTRETAPYFVSPPTLTTLSDTSIMATWTTPQITNGQIREYRLRMNNQTVYTGLNKEYIAQFLIPYKAYDFVLIACTLGGCSESAAVAGRPGEAPPAGMRAPDVRVTSSASIEITWNEPDYPNGIITSYELRRDGVLIDTTNKLLYIDYEVAPGQTYTYRVTAFNSRGNTTSPAATATTYSSSPEGLEPPQLQAISSTAIRATWMPPLRPNGDIYNYTLYVVNNDNETVYSSHGFMLDVRGLNHFTEYSFRIQACTLKGCATSDAARERTLQSRPLGQLGPRLIALADNLGRMAGVKATWLPPTRPNGFVNKYELHRRLFTGVQPELTGGPHTLIYNGSLQEFTDRDPALLPFTKYEYMVVAFNDVGSATSPWESVMTKEAPPSAVKAPLIRSRTDTTITIEIISPEVPNGYINRYIVYLDNNVVEDDQSKIVILGDTTPLEASTNYTIYVKACTAGGCTPSPPVNVQTLSRRPAGMSPVQLINATPTTISVRWQPPAQPNGPIINYELTVRRGCPYPYADDNDPMTIPCVPGPWMTQFSRADMLEATVSNLEPYTNYDFQIQVFNEAGKMINPPISTFATRPTVPQYLTLPSLQPSSNVIIVDWSKSFKINGEVTRFTLYKNGQPEDPDFTRYKTTHNVIRDPRLETYEFLVRLETDQGQAETPVFRFDPSFPGFVAPSLTSSVTPVPTEAVTSEQGLKFYEEVWFIAMIVIIALIILFLGLACCLRTSGRRVPYIRERMPLQPRQKKAPVYCIDPYNGSVVATEIPHAPVNMSPVLHGGAAHVGYVNPAYSQMSMSHNGSMLDLTLDKMSHKSSKWDDEDEVAWDGHIPNDSGLHSLAYGDDYDAASDRPISVIKEHQMFTDTHL